METTMTKRKSLADAAAPAIKPKIDITEVDKIEEAIHGSKNSKPSLTRITADIDSQVFDAMKIHCAKNKVKLRIYLEQLIREDLGVTE